MIYRLVLCAALVFVPVFAFAQSAERSITLEAEATVQSVDPDTREIVLRNSKSGETEVIVAGPEVVNFDQLEVGDTVKAVYTVGIAARMAAPGELDSAVELDGQAMEGEKPGALSGTMVTLVLEFISFDPDMSIALVRDSTGMEQSIEVESEAGREFATKLSAGDMVALTFVEGIAVGIVEE